MPRATHRASTRSLDAPPTRPWVMRQTWRSLLFAHWRIAPETLRSLVPAPLELDTHEGDAWLGVVPFLLGIRWRYLPTIPTTGAFPELNLRTYVRFQGKPGVLFLSLDATSRMAITGARALFRLPYHHARMQLNSNSDGTDIRSIRAEPGQPRTEFAARYRPTSRVFQAAPGSLAHFLTARYWLFAAHREWVACGEVDHAAWSLQSAEVEIESNSLAEPFGLKLCGTPESVLYSAGVETRVWLPQWVRYHAEAKGPYSLGSREAKGSGIGIA